MAFGVLASCMVLYIAVVWCVSTAAARLRYLVVPVGSIAYLLVVPGNTQVTTRWVVLGWRTLGMAFRGVRVLQRRAEKGKF